MDIENFSDIRNISTVHWVSKITFGLLSNAECHQLIKAKNNTMAGDLAVLQKVRGNIREAR